MIPHSRLAELCRDVYTAKPTVARGDLHAVKTVVGGTSIWAFRGTVDLQNATRDAFGFPWYDPLLGWCHAGFLDAARILGLDLAFQTEPDSPLILTGHSLGGAIAMAIGAMFVPRLHAPKEIVTYNAPRVGSWKFCRVLQRAPTKITMYRWTGDVVSEVPWLLGMFRNPVRWTMCGDWLPPIEAHRMENFLDLNA